MSLSFKEQYPSTIFSISSWLNVIFFTSFNTPVPFLLDDFSKWYCMFINVISSKYNLPVFASKGTWNALSEKAKQIISERVKYYASEIGVTYNRITIRCQRTRGGSCSSKGNLNFNCLLVLFDREIIDSVVVHELCHRKHMNHSARFYKEVEAVFPEYKRCHKWLNENGGIYLERLK